MASGHGRRRAWKAFVPGAGGGALPLDVDLEDAREGGRSGAVGVPGHAGRERLVERRINGAHPVSAAQPLRPFREPPPVGLAGAPGRGAHQRGALEKLAAHLVARVDLAAERRAPGGKIVDPRFDRVLLATQHLEPEAPLPAVVAERPDRRLAPRALARPPEAHDARQLIVAVADEDGADPQAVPEHALRRETTAVDLGLHALDHHPRRSPPPLLRLRPHPLHY